MVPAILSILYFVIVIYFITCLWEDNKFFAVILVFLGLMWGGIGLIANYDYWWDWCSRQTGIECLSTRSSGGEDSSSSIIDTSDDEGNGWRYLYDTELYYKDNAEWYSTYETYSVYRNIADKKDGCDLWVNFGDKYNVPASKSYMVGYDYTVNYEGTVYYFNAK